MGLPGIEPLERWHRPLFPIGREAAAALRGVTGPRFDNQLPGSVVRMISRLSRLNTLQRIGLALASLWVAFVFSIVAISYVNNHGPFMQRITCDEGGDCIRDPEFPRWNQWYEEPYPDLHSGTVEPSPLDRDRLMVGEAAVIAILPPLLAWVLSYVLAPVVRWLINGLRRKAI